MHKKSVLFNGVVDAEVRRVEAIEILAEEKDRPPNLERDPKSWVPRGADWEVRMRQARSALIDRIAKDDSWLEQVLPRVLCSLETVCFLLCFTLVFQRDQECANSFNIKAAWLARDGIQDNINIPSASPARCKLEVESESRC